MSIAEEIPEIDGGAIICRPAPIEYNVGDTVGVTMMSDLHIGARDADYKLMRRELYEAQANGDRILINGDVFDLILPKDHKRFRPGVLHPDLDGRADIINAAIDMAAEILEPYVNSIDMIGTGNHETAAESHHSLDPILFLLDRLAPLVRSDHTIHYGGYMGFVQYPLRYTKGNSRRALTIYYYHGGGGGSPVTKGMIDFHRLSTWVDADVIWFGHKHNRINAHARKMSCPNRGYRVTLKDQRHIQTGSYFDTYHGQTQSGVRRKGRLASYAADRGLAPQGKGGARLLIDFVGQEDFALRVVQ